MDSKEFDIKKTRIKRNLVIAFFAYLILSIVVVIITIVQTIENRLFLILGIVTILLAIAIMYGYTLRYSATRTTVDSTGKTIFVSDKKTDNFKALWILSIVLLCISGGISWFIWVVNCLIMGHC